MTKKYSELTEIEEERALAIHKKATVISTLSTFPTKDIGNTIAKFQKYCDTMKEGGLSAVNFSIANEHNIGETCSIIAHMYNLIQHVDDSMLIRTTKDIREAKQRRKRGIIFRIANTEPLERKAGAMELYYNLGVRTIQLAYSYKTRAGDGCYERTDCGVSRYGMNLINTTPILQSKT